MTFVNWLRHARAPTNCLGSPHTSRQGLIRRFEILHCQIYRQAPILSQTCLNSPHTSRQGKIFCRPTKNRLVCGGIYLHKLTNIEQEISLLVENLNKKQIELLLFRSSKMHRNMPYRLMLQKLTKGVLV